LDDGIWFRRSINAALQCPGATLLFSQLYWIQSKRDKRLNAEAKSFNDGWVWKTREEWCAETTLTEHELRTARRVLRDAGLLEEREERLKHRIQYRLIPETTFDYLLLSAPPSPMWENTHTPEEEELEQAIFENDPLWKPPVGTGKSAKKHLVESTTTPCGNRPSYLLQKNTAKIIPAMPGCPSPESPDSSASPIPTSPLEHSSTPSVVDLPPTTSAAAPPFDSDEYIDDMMDPDKEKNKAVRLIGNYLFYLGDQYPSAKAIGSVIRQNVRLANTIVEEGWTEEEIEGLMEELANDSFWKNKHWSLKNFKDRLPKYRADFAAKKNQKIVRHL